MRAMLAFARFIDSLNEHVGRAVAWLVLIAVAVSTLNALARFALSSASNAWLEAQWYMFALIFLFAAGYTLLHGGHVRVDVLYGRLSPRTQAWIDLLGGLFFLLPTAAIILWLSWPMVSASLAVFENSPDPGGLPRWPIKLAIPLAFGLLVLQGFSEVVKRVAFLRGIAPPPRAHRKEIQ